jgi:glucose/arabinose dehydrogenase
MPVVPGVRSSNGEQGLLGIAVDPEWPDRPYVYLQYCDLAAPRIRIRRFTVGGDVQGESNGRLTIDAATGYDVITDIPDLNGMHNGGTLRFGPDGMLYSAIGDDLFHCDAQSHEYLVGKILRLNVSKLPDGPGGPPPYSMITPRSNPFADEPDPRAGLVYQYGLRNPYSFHIDPVTCDLFIADVGASTWEEIDWAPDPGLNFGWAWYEGPDSYTKTCSVPGTDFKAPIYAYDRRNFGTGAAVISGGVYRLRPGMESPFPADYDGDYFFGDLGKGFLRRLKRTGNTWSIAPRALGQFYPTDWAAGLSSPVHFMPAPDGSLWYLTYGSGASGQVRRIAYYPPVGVPLPGGAREVELTAFPTPARAAVRISFTLPTSGNVEVSLYDLAGRRVKTIVDPLWMEAGSHETTWDGRDRTGAPARTGLYFVRMEWDGRVLQRNVALIR